MNIPSSLCKEMDAGKNSEIRKSVCGGGGDKHCKPGPSAVMTRNKTNLSGKSAVLMLNKACRESFA